MDDAQIGVVLRRLTSTEREINDLRAWLNNLSSGGAPLSDDNPLAIGTTSAGVATEASRSDHVHAHGNQAGGTLHSDVTTSVAGFMAAADKTKLNGIEALADVTDAVNIASSIHGVSAKTTPVDNDEIAIIDSAASNALKRTLWSSVKTTLKTYLDTLYAAISHTHSADDITSGILSVARGGTGVSVQSMFWVSRVNNQTGVANNTVTKVTWDTETLDNTAIFDLANSRCTPQAGNWLFNVSVVYASMTPGSGTYLNIYLYKNGSSYLTPVGPLLQTATGYYGVTATILVPGVSEGDYFEIYVRQSSGATQTLLGNTTYSTSWAGVRLGS